MPILIHCGPILLTLEGTLDNDDNPHNFSNEPTSLRLISLLFPQIMITLSQWKDYFCASLAPRLNPFPEFKYLIIVFFSLILLSTLGLIRMQYHLIKSEFSLWTLCQTWVLYFIIYIFLYYCYPHVVVWMRWPLWTHFWIIYPLCGNCWKVFGCVIF